MRAETKGFMPRRTGGAATLAELCEIKQSPFRKEMP